MSSTVRSLKGLVTKRNDAAVNWLQNSIQTLANIQPKESARRVRSCDRYIDLLETSLTKLTKAFDEAPETTEEEEDHLDKYIEKTQATIMKLHEHRTQLEETLEDIGIEADDRSSPSAVSRLPVIPIPTFTGRKWEWNNFWALYKANVHDQNLSQLQKFNYLLASLSGEAKQSVSRFFVSANNYEKAIQHLAKRYGNKDGIVLELNRSLHNCAARGPSTMEQRQLWDKLSTIAAQLEEHDQQLNNQLTTQTFVQKFHVRIRKAAMEKRLRHQDEHRSEWTLQQWLDAIDNIILQEEQLNHMLSYEGQVRNYLLRSGTAARVPQESRGIWRTGAPCERCGNKGHRWTTCPQIPTAIQKRRFLLETRRCLNCGSANHRIASCSRGNCRTCRRRHQTAICAKNTPREAKNNGKLKQHAVSRDTQEEMAQGTFPVDEEASKTFGLESATTLLLRRRNTASSSLHPPSSSEATAKTILFEDNSAKEGTKRQPKSNVTSSHSLKSDHVEPLAKRALVTATLAIMATAKDKKSPPYTELNLNTDAPVKIALAKEDDSASKDEVLTIHRLWEDFLAFKKKVERQHQELREWMQSMKHFTTFTTQERTNTSTKEMIHTQQGKSLQIASTSGTATSSQKKSKSEDRRKDTPGPTGTQNGRYVKNRRHREISPTTSQKRSSTASSLQKEISSKKRRRNSASPSGKTQKREERRLNYLDDQRRQASAGGKDGGSQKRLKAKRSVNRSGQAGVYELHSYQPTRPLEHGSKHSNLGHKNFDVRHKHAHERSPESSTVDKARKSSTRKGELRHTTSGNAPPKLMDEQILGNATESMLRSTNTESGIAQRERKGSRNTLCAPWQGALYGRSMRCFKKSLFETLGVLAKAFDELRMTLTDMETTSNSQWRSREQQKIRCGKEGSKKSPNGVNISLLWDAVRLRPTHRCKTTPTAQIHGSPQNAKTGAVMGNSDECKLQRRSIRTASLGTDHEEPLITDKQGDKATRCNADHGKKLKLEHGRRRLRWQP